MDFNPHFENDPTLLYPIAPRPEYTLDGFIYNRDLTGMALYPGHAACTGWSWYRPAQKSEHSPELPGSLPLPDSPDTSAPGSDLVDTLLADRLEGLDANIDRIRYELDARDRIHQNSLGTIDHNMMQCRTALFECYQWIPATNNLIERRRTELEGKILDLEREKRAEDMMNWRDRQMLLRDLREILTERGNAARRINLLDAFPDATDKPGPGQVTEP